MHNITDIFFDWDRTIWDFDANSEVVLRQIYEELHLNRYFPSFEEYHYAYLLINKRFWEEYHKGKVTKEQLREGRFVETLELFGVHDKKLGRQMADTYIALSPLQTQLFPHALEVLKSLKEKDYKLHIITNGFREVQYKKLRRSHLMGYFDVILCSEEVGVNKPNPLVFHEALHRAKTSSFVSMMVGDDLEADVRGANNVGIYSVLFDPKGRRRELKEFDRIEQLGGILRLLQE